MVRKEREILAADETILLTDGQPVTGRPVGHRTIHEVLRDKQGVFLEKKMRNQNALMSAPGEVL